MDEISRLTDDLLVKVLSFLPTKVAASTSVLSKRWEFLWMWLPKLEYDYNSYSESEGNKLTSFIDLNLPLHKAPVIESLRLKFTKGPIGSIKPEDIKLWVIIAVPRCIRELSLSLFNTGYSPTKLPSSLYTSKSLVILRLKDEILVDVPRMACLPCLKTLILRRVTYSDEKTLHQLLSNCPVLEDLVLEQDGYDNLKTLSIIVPSLQRLTLEIFRGNNFDPLVINTPSLKYLHFTEYKDDSYSLDFKDMPILEEADIDLLYVDIYKFVRSIRFVKRLSLWIRVDPEEAVYRDGIVFNQLEHLNLCSCDSNWSNVLVQLLKDSPNLRELEVYLNDNHEDTCEDPLVSWDNQDLDCVPQCLLGSLDTFKWTGMKGSDNEIDLVRYILANACCLKTATILFPSPRTPEEKFKFELMKKELPLYFRGSTTCQLVFR